MVLPAPPPDAEPGQAELAWLGRILRLLDLARRQVVILVRSSTSAGLRALLIALEQRAGPLCVYLDPEQMLDAPEGATVLLEIRPEHATWLNTYRTVLVSRQIKLVAWASEAHADHLANTAPDFWDWISHLVDAPGGPHGFALRGLAQAGPRIAWFGDDLDSLREASGRAGPSPQVTAGANYSELVEAAEAPGWLLIDDLDNSELLLRLRWALAEARRSEPCVLIHPCIAALPGWCPLHDRAMPWTAAATTLRELGDDAARVALLLDLEPEAHQRAGVLASLEPGRRAQVLHASDSGVALLGVMPQAAIPTEPSDALVWRAGLGKPSPDDEIEELLRLPPAAERWRRLAELALSLRQWDAARRWAEAVDDPSVAEAADALRSYAISRQRPPRVYFGDSRGSGPIDFVDRELELEALHAKLAAEDSVVAVFGMAGVGKTELVAQYAYQHLHDYDAIAWAQVAERELGDVLTELAQALVEPADLVPSTTAELMVVVNDALRQRSQALVVLDDVRDTDSLWLPDTGRVLITSRRGDLPLPDRASTLHLAVLAPNNALRLLLGERELQGPQLRAAHELCERLGGLPLSLAIAKRELDRGEATPQQLLARLSEDPGRLSLDMKTRLSWSLARLDADTVGDGLARDMLLVAACLADAAIPDEVIAGALSQLRAMHIADEALRVAQERLVNLGLVSIGADGLRLHPAIAQVARPLASDAHARAATHGLADLVRRDQSYATVQAGLTKLRPHLRWIVARMQPGASDDEFVLAVGLAQELRLAGDYRGTLSVCEHVLGWAQDDARRARLLVESGYAQLGLGRYADAERSLRNSLTLGETAYGTKESPQIAASLSGLANVLDSRGDFVGAERNYREALVIGESVYGTKEHPDQAVSLNGLASTLFSQGRIEEAGHTYDEALAIMAKVRGTKADPVVAAALVGQANVLMMQGKLDEAERCHRDSIAVQDKLYGNNKNPNVAASMHGLANVLNKQGKLDEAERAYRESIAIQEQVYESKDHPDIAVSLGGLASVLAMKGKLDEAERGYRESIAVMSKALDTQAHPEVAKLHAGLANVLVRQGRFEEAERSSRQAIAVLEKAYGTNQHPEVAASLHGLANVLWMQGNYEEAEHIYREVIAIESVIYGSRTSAATLSTFVSLAGLLLNALGQPEAAYPLAEEAWQAALQQGLVLELVQIGPLYLASAMACGHTQAADDALPALRAALEQLPEGHPTRANSEAELEQILGPIKTR